MRKKYNTPKRDQVVKTRLTQEEKSAFEEKCRMSLSRSTVSATRQ